MQKQKEQVMQPLSMAILIAIVFLSELSFFVSARINSSFPPVISGNRVSSLAEETMHNSTDEDRTTNFVKIPVLGNLNIDGFYYVYIEIGTPPVTYKLSIDTGSDFTWFQLDDEDDSDSMRNVLSDEPVCGDVHGSTTGEFQDSEPCDFKIIYNDGSTSEGFVVTDNFALHLRGGSSIRPTLAIGASSDPTDHGMLGLGKRKISILSQLKEQDHFSNIFGHCLSRNPGVQGFLFIGKNFDYPRCFTWAPMSSDPSHYSLTMAGVAYGDEQLSGSNNQAFVLDSGTPNTYLLDSLYQELLSKVEEVPLQQVPGNGKQPCWKGTGTTPFSHFNSIYLRLQDGKALQIPPENYLFINNAGDVCLGILKGDSARLDIFNLIGAISMQNVIIVYDNEQQRIGWAYVGGCTDPPVRSCPPN